MHEITLCQRALELIEQQAAKHGAKRVTGVWLKIGAFSCVETSSLAFCFDLVCRGSVAEGCKLHLEEQEAECWCETCPGPRCEPDGRSSRSREDRNCPFCILSAESLRAAQRWTIF